MAKLNLAKVVETGKIAGLTAIDAIIDGLGATGETIEKAGNYISEKWKDNQTRVVVLRELNEHVKEWSDFRELKEKKQALKDIPVEPKDYSPEEQARVNETYIRTYMDRMS
tara:strand:+ start:792 stop:1124 length:333 start_codon:yes stop_codon:yes gene_type:complete